MISTDHLSEREPSRSDEKSVIIPRMNGHVFGPFVIAGIDRSRMTIDPLRRRTTMATDPGARIITPSMTA